MFRSFLRWLAVVPSAIGLVALVASGAAFAAAPVKTKMDKPIIGCAGSTQASINIQVCAGATGAPAGFSLQWMTAADYAANGNQWYASDDARLCKGSFSGNANLSRYNLGAYECATVNVGEFLFDNGASTNCDGALACGTDYVFRAFSHATNTLMRSDFTANTTCTTLACGHDELSCTLTQGYWKTHNLFVSPTKPNGEPNQNYVPWPSPVDTLSLGSVVYTDAQIYAIFGTPAGGNGLIALAHQLIAAKLNVANGADPTALGTAIADADALIGSLVVPPVGTGYLAPSITSGLITILASYNEGATGPGHCD